MNTKDMNVIKMELNVSLNKSVVTNCTKAKTKKIRYSRKNATIFKP